MWILALAVFLIVLAHRGRLGPFVWDPVWTPRRRALAAPAASGTGSAEHILARRLADGELSPDEYYERLSLIQSR